MVKFVFKNKQPFVFTSKKLHINMLMKLMPCGCMNPGYYVNGFNKRFSPNVNGKIDFLIVSHVSLKIATLVREREPT